MLINNPPDVDTICLLLSDTGKWEYDFASIAIALPDSAMKYPKPQIAKKWGIRFTKHSEYHFEYPISSGTQRMSDCRKWDFRFTRHSCENLEEAYSGSQRIREREDDVVRATPNESRFPRITTLSRYICDHIYSGLKSKDATKFWHFFNLLWDMGRSCCTAGWMWEGHIIQHLGEGTEELGLPKPSDVWRSLDLERRNRHSILGDCWAKITPSRSWGSILSELCQDDGGGSCKLVFIPEMSRINGALAPSTAKVGRISRAIRWSQA